MLIAGSESGRPADAPTRQRTTLARKYPQKVQTLGFPFRNAQIMDLWLQPSALQRSFVTGNSATHSLHEVGIGFNSNYQ